MAEQKTEIKMKRDKDCKHSVRYATDDTEAPIASVYVKRSFAKTMPLSVVVSLEAGH